MIRPQNRRSTWLGDIEKDLDSAKSATSRWSSRDVDGVQQVMSGKLPAITEHGAAGRSVIERLPSDDRIEYCIRSATVARSHTRGVGDSWIDGTGAGVFSAITTPFARCFLDHGFSREHVTWLVDRGCTGIVALGSLGESATLSFDEKVAILESCRAPSAGVCPLSRGSRG